jgi:BirA family biotin operon repressor/biotin-[acetyl-CoA-carboxylase] ligase
VVLADEQTRGRGRLGRSWHSPAADNLYLSALVRPPEALHRAPPLTLAAGVAVCEAVNRSGARASIKWPNDVLVDGKKLAGILTESVTRGERLEAVVIGVGVNLNGAAFPEELAAIATSLRAACGHAIDRLAFTATLLGELARWLDRLDAEGTAAIAAAWQERSAISGRRVQVIVDGETVAGRACDLDADGALRVERDGGGELRVVAGEVTIMMEPRS